MLEMTGLFDRLPYHIIENVNLTVLFRTPRCKSWRIRKKWHKRPGNWKPDPHIYVTGQTLFCHPSVAHEVRRQLCQR